MYKEIKAIYDRERLDIFSMVTTHLMDIGWDAAQGMTDEDINKINMPDNSFMTTEFAQYLCKLAREVAKTVTPVEFIQFCQVEKLYDTKGYKTQSQRR